MLSVNIFGQCNNSFNPDGLKILIYFVESKEGGALLLQRHLRILKESSKGTKKLT